MAMLLSFWLRKSNRGLSKLWPRVLIGGVIFLVECFLLNRIRSTHLTTLDSARNFYGALRVIRAQAAGRPPQPMKQLAHGYITHGLQFTDPVLSRQPCSYYSTNSGFGLAMRFHPRRLQGKGMRSGVLGLGAGTIATYAGAQDSVRFYEINPAVIRFAAGPEAHFTYLQDCPGETSIVQADARLALERELASGQTNDFDILVMDAFSGDSVPVHLLTVEAFETYWRHMRDENGIIAVNISNRFLEFGGLMAALGQHFKMEMAIIDSPGAAPDHTPSRWCLFTRNTSFASHPEVVRVTKLPPAWKGKVTVWTDQFSNLLQLVKR
jgi:hypothetical protein